MQGSKKDADIDAAITATNGDGWITKIRQEHATLQSECIADMSEMKSLRWREEVHSIKKHRSAAEESTASGTSIDQRQEHATLQAECMADMAELQSLRWRFKV